METVAAAIDKRVQRVGPAEIAYLETGRLGRNPTAFLLHGLPTHSFLWRKVLRRFDKPAAVLWSADDAFLSPSWGVRLADDIPDARRRGLRLIPFCGHPVPDEQPEVVVEAVRDVLGLATEPAGV